MIGEPRAETPNHPVRQMSEHPITPPPPELVQQWWNLADQHCDRDDPKNYFDDIATQAARWGADQELEACCESLGRLVRGDRMAEYLRATRRKPLTLKQQALAIIEHAKDGWAPLPDDWDTIIRALQPVDG